ncbi:hypothetical protein MXMO3_01721 [Maritalea myrionectae]|uniref:Uncharacterized protein n=1 Tax=Maritalea myrionectae TaxID=454601 RepID=A0A2R4MDY8_9HYPH|nr:hypothetical protein [Maritalea myrionectae]AVX04247.1 hypothetical protein MXMO3_01721 [Maritalea myrionectae]
MANTVNNKTRSLLPLDLSTLSIPELGIAYAAAQAADLALQGVMGSPNCDIDSKVGDWVNEQAEAFTWRCQEIRNEMLKRDKPESDTEAGIRREVVLGYALRCGETTQELIALTVELDRATQIAA